MKNFFFPIFLYYCFSFPLFAQRQLDIQGKSTSADTVATIKVNSTNNSDIVGLAVTSYTGIGHNGTAGIFSGGQNGVIGISNTGVGVFGKSTGFHGVWGTSTGNIAILGQSSLHYGIYGESSTSTGAFFYGGNGIAIELGGADSDYGAGDDDSVIRSQANKASGDMILVSNDNLHLYLDDDNNSTSKVAVLNGSNTEVFTLDEAGNLTLTGTCSCSSDKNRKEVFTKIDRHKILEKIATIPISEWQFKGENIRHMGPMAQDFYQAFKLGSGETTISTTDGIGVALAAIQALNQEIQLLRNETIRLKKLIRDLQ